MPAGILGNHKIKYIVTGTPRSGTGFMAKLFTSAGVPIGHEMFFGMPGHGYYPRNAVGDSSWMAVPFAHNFDKATIIHIVRNPLDTIASLLHRNTFSDQVMKHSMYTQFKMKRLPILERFEGMERYVAFWLYWNKEVDMIETHRVKLEDMVEDPTLLLDKLGIDHKSKILHSTKYNDSGRPVNKLTLDNFSTCNNELLRKFITLSNSYGYNLEKPVDTVDN